MRTLRTRLAVLLTVLALGAFALATEPFTLGPVIKLGTVTHANLPVFSDGGVPVGGLIFDLDAGAVYFGDGTQWAAIGGSSSSGSFWSDAGAGYIGSNEALRAPDGGFIYSEKIRIGDPASWGTTGSGSGSMSSGSTSLYGLSLAYNSPIEWWFNATRSGSIFAGATFSFRSAADFQFTNLTGSYTTSNPIRVHSFLAQAASGEEAFTATTGAHVHIGNGTNDYWYSDGTGIATPSYVQGTTGFCTGSTCTGTAFASFPAASGASRLLLYDVTAGVWRANNGAVWKTVSTEYAISAFFPLGIATGAVIPLVQSRAQEPARVKNLWVTTVGAGVGAGNVVVSVENTTSGLQACTVTFGPCTAGSATTSNTACVSTDGGVPSVARDDILEIRTDTTGCTSSPAFNVVVNLNGG